MSESISKNNTPSIESLKIIVLEDSANGKSKIPCL